MSGGMNNTSITYDTMRRIIDQMTDIKTDTIRKFVSRIISSDEYERIKDKITSNSIVIVSERLKPYVTGMSFVRTSPLVKDNEVFIYEESKQCEYYSQNDTRIASLWSQHRAFRHGL